MMPDLQQFSHSLFGRYIASEIQMNKTGLIKNNKMNPQIEDSLQSLQENFIYSILELDEPTEDTLSLSSSNSLPTANTKYKTERCRYWIIAKSCPFGNSCSFAHQNWEMREKHTHLNYKTRDCHNFSRFGSCKYGDRCQFKHEVRKVGGQKNGSNFWNELDYLPLKIEIGLSTKQYVPHQKRLKVFQEFSEDEFEGVNWVYKKPRMYTM